jgi:hypothetical protein
MARVPTKVMIQRRGESVVSSLTDRTKPVTADPMKVNVALWPWSWARRARRASLGSVTSIDCMASLGVAVREHKSAIVNVRIALGKAAATFDLQSAITAVEEWRIVGDGCTGPKAIIVQLWRGRPCGRPLVRLGRAPPARTLIDLVAVDDLPKLDALAAIEGLHEPIQGGAWI